MFDKRPCLVIVKNGYYELVDNTLDVPFAVLQRTKKELQQQGLKVKTIYYGIYLKNKQK